MALRKRAKAPPPSQIIFGFSSADRRNPPAHWQWIFYSAPIQIQPRAEASGRIQTEEVGQQLGHVAGNAQYEREGKIIVYILISLVGVSKLNSSYG